MSILTIKSFVNNSTYHNLKEVGIVDLYMLSGNIRDWYNGFSTVYRLSKDINGFFLDFSDNKTFESDKQISIKVKLSKKLESLLNILMEYSKVYSGKGTDYGVVDFYTFSSDKLMFEIQEVIINYVVEKDELYSTKEIKAKNIDSVIYSGRSFKTLTNCFDKFNSYIHENGFFIYGTEDYIYDYEHKDGFFSLLYVEYERDGYGEVKNKHIISKIPTGKLEAFETFINDGFVNITKYSIPFVELIGLYQYTMEFIEEITEEDNSIVLKELHIFIASYICYTIKTNFNLDKNPFE